MKFQCELSVQLLVTITLYQTCPVDNVDFKQLRQTPFISNADFIHKVSTLHTALHLFAGWQACVYGFCNRYNDDFHFALDSEL